MKNNNVVIDFKNSEKASDILMSWLVDGGGEDILTDLFHDNGLEVTEFLFDMKKRKIEFKF